MLVVTAALEESTEVVISPEDEARAAFYGLIGHIFHAPPSSDILDAIANQDPVSNQTDTPLRRAWGELQKTARNAKASQVRQEYDDLFIGVGKAEIMLYGSYYVSGFLMEKPLAKLREHLNELGFARRQAVGEPEDHISALCEVMRVLILGTENLPAAPVETQKDFFHRHLAPWVPRLTTALAQNKISEFYSRAGQFTQEFFQIENESFEIA
jgi:TorA maturation chaperone TorD